MNFAVYRKNWLGGLQVAAIAAVLFAAGAPASRAVEADPAVLQAEADSLFRHMLVKPDDLPAAFRFAEVETRLGDYEAAIGALERMLFYNKDLPRVRLELGVLYFRLGSYGTARTYFEGAVSAPGTPDDVKIRVAGFVREIERRTATSQSAFFMQLGLRHQTNANAGPDSFAVRALGFDATLDSKFGRARDWNAFALASYTHIYDFENQRGDVWESNVSGYYARQFRLNKLDLGLIEATTGPRLAVGEATGLSFRPYVLANDVLLGSNQYFGTVGAGAGFRWRMDNGVTLDPNYEYRARRYSNSGNYPTATLQTGDLQIASLGLAGPTMLENVTWQSRVSFADNKSGYRPYGYRQTGIEFALPIEFEGPSAFSSRRWTFAPFVSWYQTGYRAVDPLVDPATRRRDTESRVGATLDTRLWGDAGFAINVQYQKTRSNISNFRTHNFSVSFGPTARF